MSTRRKQPTVQDRIRLHADEARKAMAARDAAIVEMRATGATHRAIAEAAGLTHTAIQLILKREDEKSRAVLAKAGNK